MVIAAIPLGARPVRLQRGSLRLSSACPWRYRPGRFRSLWNWEASASRSGLCWPFVLVAVPVSRTGEEATRGTGYMQIHLSPAWSPPGASSTGASTVHWDRTGLYPSIYWHRNKFLTSFLAEENCSVFSEENLLPNFLKISCMLYIYLYVYL